MALALVLASLPSSEIGRGALPCSLACCVVGESERVSSLLRRRASRPQLTHLLHVLDESALHAVGGIEGELPVIRSLQALIRLLEELGAATDAAAPLRALASLIDAGSLRLIEPAAVGAACRSLCGAAVRRLLTTDADPEVRRGGLALLSALLRAGDTGGGECAILAWRAIAHASALDSLPPWLQRQAEEVLVVSQRQMLAAHEGSPSNASFAKLWATEVSTLLSSSPSLLPGGRVLGLRLLRAHLCDPTHSGELASSPTLPALVTTSQEGMTEEARQLAVAMVPLICLRLREEEPFGLELGLTLRHLLLSSLQPSPSDRSSPHPPSHHRSTRLRALRALALVLARPHTVHRILIEHDAHPHTAPLWPSLVAVLADSSFEGEAELRLRACVTVMNQLDEQPSDAPTEASLRLQRAWQAKASLASLAAAFNSDPKAAVEAWKIDGTLSPKEESESDDTDAGDQGEALGKILFSLPGASPQAIGDYLARPEAVPKAALRSFMQSFDMSALSMDAALRLVFSALKMPGEAQKVDRVMQAFAKSYYRDEPGPFASEKAAYVMAFSLMMLNTDQHNAAVRTKMTVDQFIHNNRKINEGKDLPPQYLANLYAAVRSCEIKACEENIAMHEDSSPPSIWRWKYVTQRLKGRSLLPTYPKRDLMLRARAAGTPPIATSSELPSAQLNAMIIRDIAPAVTSAAHGVLLRASREHLQSVGGVPRATAKGEGINPDPPHPQDWALAVRSLLRLIRMSAAHEITKSAEEQSAYSHKQHAMIDQMVMILCEHSLLPSHLGTAEAQARGACFNQRSICLGSVAALLARAYPTALSDASWYLLLRTLMTMHQLGLTPSPSTTAPLNDPLAAKLRTSSGSAKASMTSAEQYNASCARATVVGDAAESLLRLGQPPPTEAVWLQQRKFHEALHHVQPNSALAVVPSLPPRQFLALLDAAFRTLDDVIPLALHDAHSGALPAANAIQVLTELLVRDEIPRVAPWARGVGCERMGRVVATSACPLPVMHAASHALRTLQTRESGHGQ